MTTNDYQMAGLAVILIIELLFIVSIYRTVGDIQREIKSKLSTMKDPLPKGDKTYEPLEFRNVERMHGFELSTPKVLEENPAIRRKAVVKIKTVAEKRREQEESKLPAVARMGHEQLVKYFNSWRGK